MTNNAGCARLVWTGRMNGKNVAINALYTELAHFTLDIVIFLHWYTTCMLMDVVFTHNFFVDRMKGAFFLTLLGLPASNLCCSVGCFSVVVQLRYPHGLALRNIVAMISCSICWLKREMRQKQKARIVRTGKQNHVVLLYQKQFHICVISRGKRSQCYIPRITFLEMAQQ